MLVPFLGHSSNVVLLGVLASFVFTCLAVQFGAQKLPHDMGREYAVQGQLSAGKPRGAGFLFILAFSIASLLFLPFSLEIGLYLLLTCASMMTGFLDDCAAIPWGEYKKGFLDLIISVLVVITYINFNGTEVRFVLLGRIWEVPIWLFGTLGVILLWSAINVTNCTDGVDGLLGTLSLITLGTFYLLESQIGVSSEWCSTILFLMSSVLAYLWYNTSPSSLMMGDAGSRALGLFIAITALKSKDPFLYIPLAVVTIIDGGAGLIKISLKRFLKISILKNIRTPIHDHVRKNKDWSNPQTVYRFAAIQAILCFVVLWLVKGAAI